MARPHYHYEYPHGRPCEKDCPDYVVFGIHSPDEECHCVKPDVFMSTKGAISFDIVDDPHLSPKTNSEIREKLEVVAKMSGYSVDSLKRTLDEVQVFHEEVEPRDFRQEQYEAHVKMRAAKEAHEKYVTTPGQRRSRKVKRDKARAKVTKAARKRNR